MLQAEHWSWQPRSVLSSPVSFEFYSEIWSVTVDQGRTIYNLSTKDVYFDSIFHVRSSTFCNRTIVLVIIQFDKKPDFGKTQQTIGDKWL